MYFTMKHPPTSKSPAQRGEMGCVGGGADKQLAHAADGVIRELAQRLASGIFRQYGKLFFYGA